MSRVGLSPIHIPDGVNISIKDSNISVKGPKGELKWNWPGEIKVKVKDNNIIVERPSDETRLVALHGTTRSIIANMVTGTSAGFQRVLEISGVGYRAQVQGQKISFTLGFSHPVEYNLPAGISAEVDKKQTQLTLQGIDKQLIGQVAANIRALRPPNVYKGKGIKYSDEMLRLKVGKTGK
jgi:large subunit ribosomal protein L6